jgi:hypothetical protein
MMMNDHEEETKVGLGMGREVCVVMEDGSEGDEMSTDGSEDGSGSQDDMKERGSLCGNDEPRSSHTI